MVLRCRHVVNQPHRCVRTMAARLAWLLLLRPAAAAWWSLVNDGALRVTDELLVGAVLSDAEPEHGVEWSGGWPAENKALCFRLGTREACLADWGPVGAPSAHLAAAAFAVDEGPGVFGATELSLDLRVINIETGRDASDTLRQTVRAEPLRRCVAEAAKRAAVTRRRVFDAFPFFNEVDVLELRLNELDDSVDVFVPVEAARTHNGGAHAPIWSSLEDDPRFRRFAPRVRSHVADVADEVPTLSEKEAALLRERQQRDAIADALSEAGARDEDIVILADADEVPDAARLNAVLACHNFGQKVLPAALLMKWHQYDFRWRARVPWGAVAREGALIVEVKDLRSRTASDFRRMLRDERQLVNRTLDRSHVRDAGWHLSSFGGAQMVKKKLQSYIEAHVYDSSFFTDTERLERLQRTGIAYYELAGKNATRVANSFECLENRKNLPRFALHHKEDLPDLFGGGCDFNETDNAWLKADVAGAKLESAGQYVLDMDGSQQKPAKKFAASIVCRRVEGDLDELGFARDVEDACRNALVRYPACDNVKHLLRAKCQDALALSDDSQVSVQESFSFLEDHYVTLTVDGAPVVVALSAASSTDAVAAQVCGEHRLDGAQCAQLRESLREQRPVDAWLPAGAWTAEAWAAAG